jgi:hypothetical protein
VNAKTNSGTNLFKSAPREPLVKMCSDGVERTFYKLNGLQATQLSVVSGIVEVSSKPRPEQAIIYYEYQLLYTALSLEPGVELGYQEIAAQLRPLESDFQDELYDYVLTVNAKKAEPAPE